MRSCPKCGSYVPDGKLLCPACGRVNIGLSTDMRGSALAEKHRTSARLQKQKNNPYAGGTYEQHKSHDFNSGDYYKSKYDHKQKEQELTNRIFCAAAYFGFFFFLPLIAMPNSKEAKFHANQGLVLFLFGIILEGIASAAAVTLGSVFDVLSILHPLLMVYGAVNAFQGKMVELPLIGKLRILKGYDGRGL